MLDQAGRQGTTPMRLRDAAQDLVVVVLVVLAASLLVGQLLGQPVLVGYVETGSMQPTLDPGDGFVAIPTFVDSSVDQGDVVVFRAETLHGGGLTTHRVVGETPEGFVTRGDANPVTDQASGEPPVERDRIVATALRLNGHVVVIPYLGTFVTGVNDVLSGFQRQLASLFGTRSLLGTRGLAYLLFATGVLSYVVSAVREDRGRYGPRRRERDSGMVDARLVVAGLTLLLVAALTLGMVAPSGSQSFSFVSAETDAAGASVVRQGTAESLTYTVPSNGMLPVRTYLEPGSTGIDVDPRRLAVGANGRANATVTLHAPSRLGPVTRTLHEHRYLALLPPGVIDALYRVHPWAPIVAIDLFVAVGFAAGASSLLGWGPIRLDSRRRRSVLDRLRRWLR